MLGMAEGAEAVFANPAGLGTLTFSNLILVAGIFPDQSLGGTVAFAQPLPSLGKAGLGISVLQPSQTLSSGGKSTDIAAREQSLVMAYCQPLFSLLDLGVRYRAVELEQPGFTPVSGETMDAGARLHLNEDLWLSLGGYNLFQPVASITGSETVSYPRFAQATLGARWAGVVKAAVEYSRAWDGTDIQRVAGGLESDISRHWFIRAGINPQAFSAGLGFVNNEWTIDYGWRSDIQASGMQHRLGLQYRFGTYQASLESSAIYLTKGGVKPNVFFKVRFDRDVLFKTWAFRIIDSDENPVYSVEGKHVLEKSFMWEGRDSKSKIVPDGDYTVFLEGVDFEGNCLSSNRIQIRVVTFKKPVFQQVK
jgi:hypothetical protein